jgi:hypothetical protein
VTTGDPNFLSMATLLLVIRDASPFTALERVILSSPISFVYL